MVLVFLLFRLEVSCTLINSQKLKKTTNFQLESWTYASVTVVYELSWHQLQCPGYSMYPHFFYVLFFWNYWWILCFRFLFAWVIKLDLLFAVYSQRFNLQSSWFYRQAFCNVIFCSISYSSRFSSLWCDFSPSIFVLKCATPQHYQNVCAGGVQGLHNIHGSFNVPNIPPSLASRNAALSGVPSSGVQQPGGSISSGRFTSNNIPVAMSQVCYSL